MKKLLKKIGNFFMGTNHETPHIQYAQNCIFSSITDAYCYKHHKECYHLDCEYCNDYRQRSDVKE